VRLKGTYFQPPEISKCQISFFFTSRNPMVQAGIASGKTRHQNRCADVVARLLHEFH
jgi:hypothetical protein